MKAFTFLVSGMQSLITLPTVCYDNFDNAPQILIPPFSSCPTQIAMSLCGYTAHCGTGAEQRLHTQP